MFHVKFRRVFFSSAAIVLPSTAALLSADEGNLRALRFWSFALPAYIHYEMTDRWLRYKHADDSETEESFNALHERYSPQAEKLVMQMRGYFLKAAQLMSVRDDFTPQQYLKWCKRMQDEAPVTFSSVEARDFVEKHIGQIFTEWQNEPIGSASIGQVYKARLRSGETVAVKVQGEHAEKEFRADMRTLRKFCELALPQFVAPLKEIEAQFMTEFDYRAEAMNLERIRSNLSKGQWSNKVVVPKPYPELCTKRVLVMEFLDGRKISDILHDALRAEALRLNIEEDVVRERFEERMRRSSLNNTAFENIKRTLYRWLGGSNPVDTFKVMDTVMRVHGYQVLVNGEFNGDPHPGNILLLKDGRIGLIDFGQVKRLSDSTRLRIAELVVAIGNRDVGKTCNLLQSLGVQSKYNDNDVQNRMISFWLDRDTPDVTNGLNIHKFLENMEIRDPAVSMNQDLVMVCRCSFMIRSLASALGLKIATTDYWRDYAEQVLQQKTMN